MSQEPGTNEEIKQFCSLNYGVTFQMMAKISVKGKDIDPLYQWLTKKEENGVMDAPVKWNFQKFMIDENGKLAGMMPPGEKPDSEKIVKWIESK
jgi:glutathione peroxidase